MHLERQVHPTSQTEGNPASGSRKCVQGGRAAGTHLPAATEKGHNARDSLWREPLQSQEMVTLALLVHLHHDTGQN